MKRWCLMESANRSLSDIWRSQHLQNATLLFPEHFLYTQLWKNLSWRVLGAVVTIQVNQKHSLAKKKTQTKTTVLWKLYKAILSQVYWLPLLSEHLSALWECCYHETVTVIPEVFSHNEPLLHFWWLYLACKLFQCTKYTKRKY